MRFPKRLIAVAPNGLALLACVGIVIGSLGFTLPTPNSGGAFPCQGHGCGCASADACWLGCCCLTPEERLAWAKENDVTPPAEFLALLEIGGKHRGGGEGESGGGGDALKVAEKREEPCPETDVASCCQQETKSCCQGAAAGCCGGHSEPASDAKIHEDDKTETGQPQFCNGRCQGLGQWWIAGGQPLALPLRPVALARATGETILPLFETRYQADPDSPPTRPG